MADTKYLIVVGPMTYFIKEGHFTHFVRAAAKFAIRDEAQAVVDIRTRSGWKVCEDYPPRN